MKGEVGSQLRDEKPEQEGHIWGSMRRTAFILGSGLLLLVAFWNSVTWHLQRFWGASGHFWQAQWERLLFAFEGKEWILYMLSITHVPLIFFWGLNGLLLVVDTTGKPSFISRYRIQAGKNEPDKSYQPARGLPPGPAWQHRREPKCPGQCSATESPSPVRPWGSPYQVDPVKLRQAIRTVLANQVLISFPIMVLLYPICKLRRDPCRRELPTFHWFLLELAVFTLIEEVMFYYSHRLLHHPKLYKKIHKKHHEWTAPIGVISLYAHPIEHVVSNMLPAVVGPLVMGSHLSSIVVWSSLALVITTISHCGYHLPFLPSPEFHDYHHLKFNQCYGVLGVLDHLHGTDTLFKQTKAYERHTLLLSLTPLSESIPDSPKME
ncbi:fatty acid hydroxylase domain containing 2 [Phyllostomus discolor]|uniref:Fatty acid hydroxylase domain containing 2 n=2 Tax=Phyllostomus discolor TaxID=89673 RepID=A0A833YXX6_9CHIR|nr:fatty acid hydroxylase domain containing 2 [Phyllostomus discolor]